MISFIILRMELLDNCLLEIIRWFLFIILWIELNKLNHFPGCILISKPVLRYVHRYFMNILLFYEPHPHVIPHFFKKSSFWFNHLKCVFYIGFQVLHNSTLPINCCTDVNTCPERYTIPFTDPPPPPKKKSNDVKSGECGAGL